MAAMSSDSFYYPLNPMEEGFDGFGGGFSFLSRLSESTGGTKLVAMAANGTTLNQYGTVCDVIYILDDAGYMWILEAPKRGSYGFSFVPTDLSVDFPMYEKLQYCSMVAGDDGNLYLSRFTGDGTEIYRLSWDAEQGMFVSALVTNMGSGVARRPVCGEAKRDGRRKRHLCAGDAHVYGGGGARFCGGDF